jgi:Transmembrane amino acid transporter protein
VILFIYGRTIPGLYYLSELYALGIFLSFPMLLFPIAASVLNSPTGQRIFGIDAGESYVSAVIFRGVLITFCYLCSITGINIIDFVNLTGAGFNCVTAFVFPIIFYINYFEKKGELSNRHKNFLIFLLILCSLLSLLSLIDGVVSIATGRNG